MKVRMSLPAIAAIVLLGILVSGNVVEAMRVSYALPPVAPVTMPDPASPPGGDYTTALTNRNAFSEPGPLNAKERRVFFFGNRLFNTNWTTAPGSVKAFDGLGPVFNRVSCSACHTRDGRGRAPMNDETGFDSMLLRVSVPGKAADGGPNPHPAYGDQINDQAILGVPPEMRIHISWETVSGKYDDGTSYELKKPVFTFSGFAFGPLGPQAMISPRVASQVIGLGLLDAVYDNDILKRADPDDKDGDGISGRANWVPDPVTGKLALGRFGWKANQPSVLAQDAAAAFGDMGLTTTLHPEQNCMPSQTACRAAPHGGEPEISDVFLEKLVFYSKTLAVPARRDPESAQIIAGSKLFASAGCAACHTPTMTTGHKADPISLANQTFHPFTDLLLHDMGPELADGRPDYLATGNEWRTPPLWGIGLISQVNDHQQLLHDGRANGVAEAILWHGGEAAAARDRFKALGARERADLVAYVNSL